MSSLALFDHSNNNTNDEVAFVGQYAGFALYDHLLFPDDADCDADCGNDPCTFVPSDELPSRDSDDPLNFLLMLEEYEEYEGDDESEYAGAEANSHRRVEPDTRYRDFTLDDDVDVSADQSTGGIYDDVEEPPVRARSVTDFDRRYLDRTRHAKPAYLHSHRTGKYHAVTTRRRDRADRSSGQRRWRTAEPEGHLYPFTPGAPVHDQVLGVTGVMRYRRV